MAKKAVKHKKLNEIVGLCFFLVGVFILASLFFHHPEDHPFFSSRPNQPLQNPTGLIGVYLSHYSLLFFGLASYLISAVFVFWSVCHFMQRVPEKRTLKLLGFFFFLFASSGLGALLASADFKTQRGGLIGYLIDSHLEKYFGPLGAFILLTSFLVLSLLLATDFLIFPFVAFLAKKTVVLIKLIKGLLENAGEFGLNVWDFLIRRVRVKPTTPKDLEKKLALRSDKEKEKQKEKELKNDKPEEKGKSFFAENLPIKVKKYEPTLIQQGKASVVPPVKQEDKPKVPKPAAAEKITMDHSQKEKAAAAVALSTSPQNASQQQAPSIPIQEIPVPADYALPPLDLLKIPQVVRKNVDQDLKEKSKILTDTLRDFDIDARVVEIEQGPTVTRYELMPAPGVKVASITGLSDDLALALKAASIRIIAPIPGKAAVGIEVPNSVTDTVFLRELLEDGEIKKSKLPLILGKDTSGKPLIADLAEMPHLLIAGTTGSGKTVCLNAIIAGLLCVKRPDELKFVMIDPKMVEMGIYNSLPHMITPVVTDVKKAAATLNWVVSEMENRYRIFSTCMVRNIQGFNERENKEEYPQHPSRLPYIIVVIDELADLMMVAQDKVETSITRLAQLSRAVGIHLILATQRPSVDVITGVIKANFPARIAFKVAGKVDSRTVLDCNGADKLLGKGDMLFLEPGEAKPTRGQAAYLSDQEIGAIVKFIQDQRKAQYQVDSEKIVAQEVQQELSGEKDELYEQAVKVVLDTRQASTSILQRRLRLGYGRAARILDMMEAEGIVGPPQGTKPREVLVDQVATTPQS